MVAYLQARDRLWTACGVVVGGILVGWDVVAAAPSFVSQYAVRNDFRLDYAAATLGLHRGYSHLYDLAAQRQAILDLGPNFNVQAFISPPPLAWLATPLTLLPFTAALAVWTGLLLAALLWTWYVAAPGSKPSRAAHLLLWLGVFPVAFGVLVGQPGALVAAAVATAWWLIRKDRDVAAGIVLSLALVKPQLALLVPLCLLVAGYRRTFFAWLVSALVIGGVTLAVLGADGVNRYREALLMTQGPAWDITRRYAISGLVGQGPLLNLVQATVVGLVLVAAWRRRRPGPEIPIAAGISGSLLFSPYLGFQDLLMLVVAGWLIVRAGATATQVALLVTGYALLQLAIPALAVPTLVAEACLLLTLVWSRRWDSNPRPATYEAAALPAELRRQI